MAKQNLPKWVSMGISCDKDGYNNRFGPRGDGGGVPIYKNRGMRSSPCKDLLSSHLYEVFETNNKNISFGFAYIFINISNCLFIGFVSCIVIFNLNCVVLVIL